MSMWAYLPVGPLERHDWEGGVWGDFGKRSIADLQKGMDTFRGWDNIGEASAC